MIILWVTCAAIGRTARALNDTIPQSGGWIDSSYCALLPYLQEGKIELHIACLGSDNREVYVENDIVTYHSVDCRRNRGREGTTDDVKIWEALIDRIRPDIIQIWGTEFSFGLDIEKAAGSIPVLFYIQGVVNSLAKHFTGDVSYKELFQQLGVSSIHKLYRMHSDMKKLRKHAYIEKKMIRRSSGVISDNEWVAAQLGINDSKLHYVPLSLNEVFQKEQWNPGTMVPHSVFTVAGGSTPAKGLHNLIKAILVVKESYPDVVLKIPGDTNNRKPDFIYQSLCMRQLNKLIKKYGLENNVEFIGRISQEDMASIMVESNVFVMPSCVETHSSTLREAMALGCPCVTSAVGSVIEFASHKINSYLYRYDEYETLAYYIMKCFDDKSECLRMGNNARETINSVFPQESIGDALYNVYLSCSKG